MNFSRHISKSIKHINQVVNDINQLDRYTYNINATINIISLTILFDNKISSYYIDMITNDLVRKLDFYYISSCLFCVEKKLIIYLKSIL